MAIKNIMGLVKIANKPGSGDRSSDQTANLPFESATRPVNASEPFSTEVDCR